MALIKNPWVGYLDRSYQQIKTSVLSRLTTSNPELTDHSESNPFIILLSIFSGITELINYYIDNSAEEAFLPVAKRTSSVIKHARGLDYRVKPRTPEQVDLHIVFSGPSPSIFTISAGLLIQSNTGISFISTEDVVISSGQSSCIIPIAQLELVNNPSFGLTNNTINQKFSLGTNYANKTIQLSVDSDPYTEVDSFARSNYDSAHFIVEVREDGNAYIILGDGVKGIKPSVGLTVEASYYTTLGPLGKVGSGGFDKNTLVLNSSLPGGLSISTANSQGVSSGGNFYEDIEDIRARSIASVRTLGRAVTPRDHIDILEAIPGIARAEVSFCCGKTISLYIVPAGGGIASSMLVTTAQNEITERKMVTTFPTVKPAGETDLVIGATIIARKRKSIIETKNQVESALIEFGLVDNQLINGAVRLSDLQAVIDNQENVDYVEITALYTKPYPRPIEHTTNLVWTNITKLASIETIKWRLEYDSPNFRVFRNGIFLGSIPTGDTFVDSGNTFEFTISSASYINGQAWEFYTYPYLKSIQLVDFTILSVKSANLSLTVNAATNIQGSSICS